MEAVAAEAAEATATATKPRKFALLYAPVAHAPGSPKGERY